MFAIRLLVSPCRARCSPRLVGRSTVTVPSACSTLMSAERRWLSSPFGPLTATLPGATSTVTLSGTEMGFLTILLMGILVARSPDVGDDLAADALLLGFMPGHPPGRGADDRVLGPAIAPRHLVVFEVAPAARPRDSLHPGDHRPAVLGVLEADSDRL